MDGRQFRRWREVMGYSQQDAAEALGFARSSVALWESGKVKISRSIGLACEALYRRLDEWNG